MFVQVIKNPCNGFMQGNNYGLHTSGLAVNPIPDLYHRVRLDKGDHGVGEDFSPCAAFMRFFV